VAKRQARPRPEPRSYYPPLDTEDVAPEVAATSPDDQVEDQAGVLNFTRGVTAHEVRLLLHIAAQLQIRFPDGAPDFSEEQWRRIGRRAVFAYPTNWKGSTPGASLREARAEYELSSVMRTAY
jgi:hypothetical protein